MPLHQCSVDVGGNSLTATWNDLDSYKTTSSQQVLWGAAQEPYLCSRQTAGSRNGGAGNSRWARCGPSAWRAPARSRACRPAAACSDLPGKEGEGSELGRVVVVLRQGQTEVKAPELRDVRLTPLCPSRGVRAEGKSSASSTKPIWQSCSCIFAPLRNAFLLLSTVEGAWASLLSVRSCASAQGSRACR